MIVSLKKYRLFRNSRDPGRVCRPRLVPALYLPTKTTWTTGIPKEPKYNSSQTGFTLIEILMALMIFAVIAVITSSVLYHVFNTRERINIHADNLAQLQLASVLLQRDFQQSCNRPIDGPDFQLKPAFLGEQQRVEFTSSGELNPLSTFKRSSLRRIAYLIKNKQLIRRRWNSLDRVSNAYPKDKVILSNVSRAQFNYLDDKLNVKPNWDSSGLPIAIQMNLTIQHWGTMSLLFLIPAGAATNDSPA